MLLTVDVGNTNIAFGVLDQDQMIGRYRLMTSTIRTSDEYGFFITTFLNQQGIAIDQIEDVIISSVVPKLMWALTSAFIKYVHKTPIIINSKMQMPIQLNMLEPSSVGADRIVNATYAFATYHKPCIIVDFGTATTFDYIDEHGGFQYVTIMPGVQISANALTNMTAKLPEIEIQKPESVFGSTTIEGMQAGLVYGYIGGVEYILKQMQKELQQHCIVIATGGLGKMISQYTDEIHIYDPDVAYKGMKILYELNQKKL